MFTVAAPSDHFQLDRPGPWLYRNSQRRHRLDVPLAGACVTVRSKIFLVVAFALAVTGCAGGKTHD
ncbi:MAG: hypothetical protein E5W94_30890, partial [Mesorhizobium sp.]